MSAPAGKGKWGADKMLLLLVVFLLVTVGVPRLVVLYLSHKVSQAQ